ncbi:hypothetical protein TNCV_581751 [Trichonephila clavipes]|nr:hypothetical protein TNCV_581751 [Trichonephila clavipes]
MQIPQMICEMLLGDNAIDMITFPRKYSRAAEDAYGRMETLTLRIGGEFDVEFGKNTRQTTMELRKTVFPYKWTSICCFLA